MVAEQSIALSSSGRQGTLASSSQMHHEWAAVGCTVQALKCQTQLTQPIRGASVKHIILGSYSDAALMLSN